MGVELCLWPSRSRWCSARSPPAMPDSRLDAAINLFCFAGISIPTFWLALVLILVFAAGLGWLPAGGVATAGAGDLADRPRHLGAAGRDADPGQRRRLYPLHARGDARGAGAGPHPHRARQGRQRGAVIFRHAMRSAMIPVTTILALSFGGLVSGALVTETMFAYPGMGKLIFDAVMGNDYNLALAALLLAAVTAMLANLAADLAYAWLDPRVSIGETLAASAVASRGGVRHRAAPWRRSRAARSLSFAGPLLAPCEGLPASDRRYSARPLPAPPGASARAPTSWAATCCCACWPAAGSRWRSASRRR